MNGKRVRMAVMSAVILSALAVSGCSSEGSVSYNGSGEKADDVSASLSTPVTSDTTNSSESKETQEQTSYESKPAVTTTNKAETTAVTTKKDNAVKSEWKETKADGTKYVTVGCYSRLSTPFSSRIFSPSRSSRWSRWFTPLRVRPSRPLSSRKVMSGWASRSWASSWSSSGRLERPWVSLMAAMAATCRAEAE